MQVMSKRWLNWLLMCIRDYNAKRYLFAGRVVTLARDLGFPSEFASYFDVPWRVQKLVKECYRDPGNYDSDENFVTFVRNSEAAKGRLMVGWITGTFWGTKSSSPEGLRSRFESAQPNSIRWHRPLSAQTNSIRWRRPLSLYPLVSHAVKLPNSEQVYRLYQDADVVVNARVARASPQIQAEIVALVQGTGLRAVTTEAYFFSELFLGSRHNAGDFVHVYLEHKLTSGSTETFRVDSPVIDTTPCKYEARVASYVSIPIHWEPER